ncbi:unnamed protein product, partial [Urochloa humidicola]
SLRVVACALLGQWISCAFVLASDTEVEKLQLAEKPCVSMADDIKFVLWLLLLSGLSSCFGSDLDVQCLKTVQESVIDPNGILKSSWIFNSSTVGFICQFTGVECWHPFEN